MVGFIWTSFPRMVHASFEKNSYLQSISRMRDCVSVDMVGLLLLVEFLLETPFSCSPRLI